MLDSGFEPQGGQAETGVCVCGWVGVKRQGWQLDRSEARLLSGQRSEVGTAEPAE